MPGIVVPPIPANAAFYAGPILLGIMFNWGLLGALIVQVYIYYLCYPNDKKWIKTLVYVVFFLELVQTGLSTADAFHWFVYGFGDVANLATNFIAPFDAPVMHSTIGTVVQLFYCWRLWTLCKSRLLCVAIALISLVHFSAGLVTGIYGFKYNAGAPQWHTPMTVYLSSAVVVDLLIATSMIYFLSKSRQRASKRTEDIISRLVRLTVETNGISVLFVIVTLVLEQTFQSNMTFCSSYVLGKIYSNSMLASLNNRVFMSKSMLMRTVASNYNRPEMDIQLPRIQETTPESGIKVEVLRETTVFTDRQLDTVTSSNSSRV